MELLLGLVAFSSVKHIRIKAVEECCENRLKYVGYCDVWAGVAPTLCSIGTGRSCTWDVKACWLK